MPPQADEKIELKTFLDAESSDDPTWVDPKYKIHYYDHDYVFNLNTIVLGNNTVDYGAEPGTTFRMEKFPIQYLYFENFDGSKVKNVYISCDQLTELDVRCFNGPLEGFSFQNCHDAKTINTTGWNTSNVKSLNDVFNGCRALKSIPGIEHWDTSNVETMKCTFMSSGIEYLPIYNWDTSNVISMESMFEDCMFLQYLPVSHWNVSKVWVMNRCFFNCMGLNTLDLENWETNDVDITRFMVNCGSLVALYTGDNGFGSIYLYSQDMFVGANNIQVGYHKTCYPPLRRYFGNSSNAVSKYNLDWIVDDLNKIYHPRGIGAYRHEGYDVLEEVHFIDFDELPDTAEYKTVSKSWGNMPIYIYAEMSDTPIRFGDYTYTFPKKLYFVSEGRIDISAWTDESGRFLPFDESRLMFYPKKYNFKNVVTTDATSMRNMFKDSTRLTELDLSKFDTSQVTDMSGMFYNCSSLETIYVSDKWDVGYVTSSFEMFAHCEKLKGDIEYKDSNPNDKTNATTTSGYLTYVPPG